MHAICIGVVLSVFAFLGAAAQTPVAKDPQALQILQRALAALSPNIAVQDVTLSGSAHYIAGSVVQDDFLDALFPGEITNIPEFVKCSSRLKNALTPDVKVRIELKAVSAPGQNTTMV